MVIIKHLKNIVKHSFRLLLIVVLSTFATAVASAKTINNSNQVLDYSRYDYFVNLYMRSEYKNYLLASEYIQNNYSYYTDYYICLTNEDITINSSISASATCSELYRWNYRANSDNVLEKVNDTNLIVNNSVYYVNNVKDKGFISEKMLIALNVGLFALFLYIVILGILRFNS